MGNHELWCISRFPISSSGLRNGGDGAFQGNRDIILQAPINRGIFNYLNLIKLSRSNYEVRIVVIIITTQKMFRTILQITANQDDICAKYVKY